MNHNAEKCLELLAEIKARGFPVPPAINVAEPQPLALTTRDDIAAYVAAHGGGADEARLLGRLVGSLTRTSRYQDALAADLSARVSIITGETVDLVSESDRHSAALQIHAKAVRFSRPPASVREIAPAAPKASPISKPAPAAPPPVATQKPVAPPPSSPAPFRNGAQLSDAEIEKRRQALAALKPKTEARP
jgi:hypothetical protein